MRDFKELVVWQKSHALTLEKYRLTKRFPREEMYGLTSQIRRCASSIPANIAEGCGRSSDAEMHRFLVIALGSIAELEYHLLLSKDLSYLPPESHQLFGQSLTEIRRMLIAFARKLRPLPS